MKLASAIASICMVVYFAPWLDDLLKMYLVAMIVIITLTINVVFRIEAIWGWLIIKIEQEVLRRLLEDEDMRKIVKMRYDAMMERLRESPVPQSGTPPLTRGKSGDAK
jgi:hypothetical protein